MSSTAGAPAKLPLLVVDDTPENLTILCDLLKGEYKVLVATNGEKALSLAASSRPAMILLDIMMPGMDGYEVITRLKAEAGTKDIPVIFLTAMSAAEDRQKGLALGAVDFITKPIDPEQVTALVKAKIGGA